MTNKAIKINEKRRKRSKLITHLNTRLIHWKGADNSLEKNEQNIYDVKTNKGQKKKKKRTK
jgi:hypothetical protein